MATLFFKPRSKTIFSQRKKSPTMRKVRIVGIKQEKEGGKSKNCKELVISARRF